MFTRPRRRCDRVEPPLAPCMSPIASLSALIAPPCAPNTRRNAYRTPLTSPTSRHAGRILSASTLSSSPAPALNPHSARCSAGAQLPATSCLGAFLDPGQLSVRSLFVAGVQKPSHVRTHALQQTASLSRSLRLRGRAAPREDRGRAF
jgi:hypothetical protein